MAEIARNTDYRFDVQLAEGLAVEAWFYEMTRGDDRFEVKHDRRALDTKRVYVETHHDPGRTGEWKPCGISRSEAGCWIFALGDPPSCFVGVTLERLRLLAEHGSPVQQPHGSCPTRGVAVPLRELIGLS